MPALTFGGHPYRVLPYPLQVTFAAVRETPELMVECRFNAALEGPCQRCLMPTRFDYNVSLDEPLRALWEDGLVAGSLSDPLIDLTQLAIDGLVALLPVPVAFVCLDGRCRGLCPECGTNLNTDPCHCVPSPGAGAFGALKVLKAKLEE